MTNTSSKTFLNALDGPVTLTIAQFFFVAAWTGSLAQAGYAFQLGWIGKAPIRRLDAHVWKATAPMSVFVLCGHLFSSVATSKIPVSTVHTVKALSPIFTVFAYVLLFKVKYSIGTYISLVPLTIGVMLACSNSFTTNGNTFGLVCALGSTLIFVSQNIFSKKVLFHERNDEPINKRLDKLNLLFYSSSMAFVMMIPIWWIQESSLVFNAPALKGVYFELFFNGTSHAVQNVLAFTLLSMVSPVTYSVASLIKRLFVIVVAILWFGSPTNATQAGGIGLTALGLYLYDRAKGDVAKIERTVEKIESGGMLPLNAGDLSDSARSSPAPFLSVSEKASFESTVASSQAAPSDYPPSSSQNQTYLPNGSSFESRTTVTNPHTLQIPRPNTSTPKEKTSLSSTTTSTTSTTTSTNKTTSGATNRRISFQNPSSQRPRSMSLGRDSGIEEDSGTDESIVTVGVRATT